MFFVPSPFHLPLRVIPSPSRRRASLSRSFRTDACVSDLSRPSRINAEYCLLRPTFLAARSTTRWVGEFPRCTNTYARLSLSLSLSLCRFYSIREYIGAVQCLSSFAFTLASPCLFVSTPSLGVCEEGR